MTERFNPNYVLLTSEQLAKLPWNRLKNIMNSVRAVISSIESHHGYNFCECCSPPKYLDETMYKTVQDRDYVVGNILLPHRKYFQMLKTAAAQLPHKESRKIVDGKLPTSFTKNERIIGSNPIGLTKH